ncbi:hypothetical protein GCM10023185_21050 [Hymenobacter saemangeumensis]|uniref:Uncharacterized protein n=1 Tax=Hymenobacter saemangeumensis TaxID=1084522 RepID=A0ABP8IDR3_9BACT
MPPQTPVKKSGYVLIRFDQRSATIDTIRREKREYVRATLVFWRAYLLAFTECGSVYVARHVGERLPFVPVFRPSTCIGNEHMADSARYADDGHVVFAVHSDGYLRPNNTKIIELSPSRNGSKQVAAGNVCCPVYSANQQSIKYYNRGTGRWMQVKRPQQKQALPVR